MTKRETEDVCLTKEGLFQALTQFEECVCDAITLNSALMILIGNETFKDFNYHLLLEISQRLNTAKKHLNKGYGVMKEMG